MFVWTARIGASLILGTALVLGVGGVASAGPVAYSDVQVGELQHVVDQNRLAFGGLVGDPLTGIVTIFVAESADPNAVAVGIAATRLVGSSEIPNFAQLQRPGQSDSQPVVRALRPSTML